MKAFLAQVMMYIGETLGLEIAPSVAPGGLGLFVTKDLEAGSILTVEEAFIDLAAIPDAMRKVWQLFSHYEDLLSQGEIAHDLKELDEALQKDLESHIAVSPVSLPQATALQHLWSVLEKTSTVLLFARLMQYAGFDGGVYPIVSLANCDCFAFNARLEQIAGPGPSARRRCVQLRTTKALQKGEEVFVSYVGNFRDTNSMVQSMTSRVEEYYQQERGGSGALCGAAGGNCQFRSLQDAIEAVSQVLDRAIREDKATLRRWEISYWSSYTQQGEFVAIETFRHLVVSQTLAAVFHKCDHVDTPPGLLHPLLVTGPPHSSTGRPVRLEYRYRLELCFKEWPELSK